MAPEAPLLIPNQVVADDYRILRPLGEGGMGAVYAVEQRSTGSRCALKVMHQRLQGDATQRERFLREAKAASAIASEHVVQVLGSGVDGSGHPWLAMELLDGQDLHDEMKRGPLCAADQATVLRAVGSALAAAHRLDIVHRDLKPRNIFLSRRGEELNVKVLDFGIAKVLSAASLTGSMDVLGTPGWMAPEQSDPRADVRTMADVWSFALVVFHVLTGRPFWQTYERVDGSVEMLLREVLIEPLPLAHERAEGLGAELSPRFDPWFARCLSRNPNDRFPNAGEAVRALEAIGIEKPGIGQALRERGRLRDGESPYTPMSSGTTRRGGALHSRPAPAAIRRRPLYGALGAALVSAFLAMLGIGAFAWGAPSTPAEPPPMAKPPAAVPIGPGLGDAPPEPTSALAAESLVAAPPTVRAPTEEDGATSGPPGTPAHQASRAPARRRSGMRADANRRHVAAPSQDEWRAQAFRVLQPLARQAGRQCTGFQVANARFAVAADGRVTEVSIPGAQLPAMTRSCLETVMSSARLPAPGQTTRISVTIFSTS